jgi:hypothetical protein
MVSLDNSPSIFGYLPIELALDIFQLAACSSQQTGKSLVSTSSVVRRAVLPVFMRNIHIRSDDGGDLFFGIISYRPELAALVECIWLEGVRPDPFYLQSFPNLSALIISGLTPSPLTSHYHRLSLMCESNSTILGLLMDLQSRSSDQPILGTGIKHVTVAFQDPMEEKHLSRILHEVRSLEPRLAWLRLYKYSAFRDGWCGQQIDDMNIWDLAEKSTASEIAALQNQTEPDAPSQNDP